MFSFSRKVETGKELFTEVPLPFYEVCLIYLDNERRFALLLLQNTAQFSVNHFLAVVSQR